jgi:hypothetical protein
MKTYHMVLAGLMLLTGTINTIVTKYVPFFFQSRPLVRACSRPRYADITCAMGVDYYPTDQSKDDNPCSDRTSGSHQFDHPFVQVCIKSLRSNVEALAMFIGEFLCILAYKLMVWRASYSRKVLKKDVSYCSPQRWTLIKITGAL